MEVYLVKYINGAELLLVNTTQPVSSLWVAKDKESRSYYGKNRREDESATVIDPEHGYVDPCIKPFIDGDI